MDGDLDLVADLRGLLVRDLPLAFGSLLFGFSATVRSPTCCDAQRFAAEPSRFSADNSSGVLGIRRVLWSPEVIEHTE